VENKVLEIDDARCNHEVYHLYIYCSAYALWHWRLYVVFLTK